MSEYTLSVKIIGDAEAFEKGVDQAKKKFKDFEKEIENTGLGGLEKKLDGFAGNMNKIGGALTGLGKALLPVTVGVTAMGGVALKTAIDFTKLYESTMIVFESMLGGKDAARGLYNELLDVAKASTFSQETFLTAGKKLVGMGVSAERTTNYLKAAKNAVAAFGGTAADIESIADVFAKVSTTGKMTALEIRQLGTNGVRALEILGNQYGVTTAEMQDMISNGIPGKEALDKLADGIENGTDGVNGMTQALSGMGAKLKGGTLTGGFDSLKTAVRSFSLQLIGINPTLDEHDEKYASSQKRIEQLTATLSLLSDILSNRVAPIFGSLTDGVGGVLGKLVGTNAVLDEATGKWKNVGGVLGKINSYLKKTDPSKLKKIGDLILGLAVAAPILMAVGAGFTFIGKAAKGSIPMINGVKAAITAIQAHPIVAVVAAVAALVIALYAANRAFRENNSAYSATRKEAQALRIETEELTDAYKAGAKAREDSLLKVEAEAESTRALTGELDKLLAKTDKTATDHELIKQKVEELNRVFPDLGLTYDEVSGKLNKGTDEIYKNIDAMKEKARVEAIASNYTAAMEEQLKIQQSLRSAVATQQGYLKEKNALEERQNQILQDRTKFGAFYAESEYSQILADLERINDAYNEQAGTIGDLQGAMSDVNGEMDYYNTLMEESAAKRAELSVAEAAAMEEQKISQKDYNAMLEEESYLRTTALPQALENQQKAQDALTAAQKAYDENKSPERVAELTEALNTATTNANDADNAVSSLQSKLDGLSAAVVGAQLQLGIISDAFGELAESASDPVAYQEAATANVDALVEQYKNDIPAFIEAVRNGTIDAATAGKVAAQIDFPVAGNAAAEGMITGMDAMKPAVEAAARAMANAAYDAAMDTLKAKSPSRLFKYVGRDVTAQGYALGIEEGTKAYVTGAARDMAAVMTDASSWKGAGLPVTAIGVSHVAKLSGGMGFDYDKIGSLFQNAAGKIADKVEDVCGSMTVVMGRRELGRVVTDIGANGY